MEYPLFLRIQAYIIGIGDQLYRKLYLDKQMSPFTNIINNINAVYGNRVNVLTAHRVVAQMKLMRCADNTINYLYQSVGLLFHKYLNETGDLMRRRKCVPGDSNTIVQVSIQFQIILSYLVSYFK